MRLVCEHPGALHVVNAAAAPTINVAASTVTEEEVEWLKLVRDAIELCGKEVAPVDWGTERDATLSIVDELSHVRPSHEHLQPVWRPTSSAPLWVCKEHAAHYRTRAAGNDEAKDKL